MVLSHFRRYDSEKSDCLGDTCCCYMCFIKHSCRYIKYALLEEAKLDDFDHPSAYCPLCVCSIWLCRSKFRTLSGIMHYKFLYSNLPHSHWAYCILGMEANDHTCLHWDALNCGRHYLNCNIQKRNWMINATESKSQDPPSPYWFEGDLIEPNIHLDPIMYPALKEYRIC